MKSGSAYNFQFGYVISPRAPVYGRRSILAQKPADSASRSNSATTLKNHKQGDLPDGGSRGSVLLSHLDKARPVKLWRPTGGIDIGADDISKHSEVNQHLGGLGNPVVGAGGVDFSIGYANKNLGNVAETIGIKHFQYGTLASRPAAGTAGQIYHAHDAGTNGITYRDTGTAWEQIGVGHLADISGTTDNVTEGTNKFAAEHGADVTGSHTANDTANVNGAAAATVQGHAARAGLGLDTSGNVQLDVPDAHITQTGVTQHQGAIDALALTNAPATAGADVTADNTAASIAGQGALATKSNVDLATTDVLNKNTDNIAETGNNLHLKPALQTQLGQNSQSANLLYNWEFRNTDFWAPGNNITVPSPGVMQFSWSANNSGGTQYTTVPQVDERNNIRHFAVKAGDILTIEADARLVSGATPLSVYVESVLIDAAASAHYTGLQANLYTANITSSFQTIKGTFTIPSTVGSGGPAPAYIGFTFGVVLSNGTGGGTVEWRRPRVAINHQTLTDSGGAQLGSGLNLFSLNSAGYATAYWTGASFTPSPGGMYFSAATLHVGGESISYNSSSISGQGYSTTYSYFYQDKGYAGGSQTLQATTSKHSLISNDANIYIGDATTQSSGGGGGGGTLGTCLALDMFIRPNVPTVMACVGQKFDAYDKFTALGERTLLNAWTATGAAVRITTSNGSVLDCGEDTPFDLKDGTSKLAKDMLGETVITDGGEDTVASVTSIGVVPLMYVSGGGVSIMAGADPTKRVASHNGLKP